jgi:predicted nucleic acid-binding protein
MSRLYLPDTNAWSHYFSGRFPTLTERFVKEFERLHLSSIVLAELRYGASKSGIPRHRARVEDLAALCPLQAFTDADASEYGHLRSALEKKGLIDRFLRHAHRRPSSTLGGHHHHAPCGRVFPRSLLEMAGLDEIMQSDGAKALKQLLHHPD